MTARDKAVVGAIGFAWLLALAMILGAAKAKSAETPGFTNELREVVAPVCAERDKMLALLRQGSVAPVFEAGSLVRQTGERYVVELLVGPWQWFLMVTKADGQMCVVDYGDDFDGAVRGLVGETQ